MVVAVIEVVFCFLLLIGRTVYVVRCLIYTQTIFLLQDPGWFLSVLEHKLRRTLVARRCTCYSPSRCDLPLAPSKLQS